MLQILEHALMLSHVREMSRAEIAETIVLRLRLVILQRLQKGAVLHDGV
jgi:hypothetical protein